MSDTSDTNTYIDTMDLNDPDRFTPLPKGARVTFWAPEGDPRCRAGCLEAHWSDDLGGLVITSSGMGQLSVTPRVSNSIMVREVPRP